ncbi:MAG: hypothetical protein AB7K24_04090 [Gemmataceae bacterium]
MIHAMLCTLMIGNVLPEPEPCKYCLTVQVLEWHGSGVEWEELEPPEDAWVIAEMTVPLWRNKWRSHWITIAPEPGADTTGQLGVYVRADSVSTDWLRLEMEVTYWRTSDQNLLTDGKHLHEAELRVGDRHWLGNSTRVPNRGFVARLHRAK